MTTSTLMHQIPAPLAYSATTMTSTHKVSHGPQHWHYHAMTAIISSTPPPPSHNHHSHHHPYSPPHSNLAYTIRPGNPTDLTAIHKIYTYYALNSSITLLVHAPDLKYIEKAFEMSISHHMPYFVAVTSSKTLANSIIPSVDTPLDDEGTLTSKTKGLSISQPESDGIDQDVPDQDIVLGYGHVVPLHADKAGYGPAVELTIYVHPSYLTSRIGSAIFSALEQQLREHPILIFEDGYREKAIERPAEVVVARMSNDLERDFEGVKMGGLEDGEQWPAWKAQGEKNKEWYLRKGFEEVGRMKRVGEKFGKK